MHIITLLNEKGGVGKTTLATHIAAGLAIMGYRVILADADPQGHATTSLGLKKAPGLYDLLVRNASFTDVLRRVSPELFEIPGHQVRGGLFVIPSNVETRGIPMMVSDSLIVLKRFSELRNSLDVVIFDTPPTPSLLHSAIYMATDSIVYPTECEYLSIDGLRESLKNRKEFQAQREKWGLDVIELMGIVPTKYRRSTVLHNQNLDSLRKLYKDKVWEPLTLRTVWGEASQMRRPVFNLAPESAAAGEVWSVVTQVQESIS